MSWSLKIRNGDFVVDQGRLDTVTGVAKLAQDLRCCFLEPMGTDSMHLEYGSILDGGTLPSGEEVSGVIGEVDSEVIRSFVRSEINRIVSDYQSQQIARSERDRLKYNKLTIDPNEALDDVHVNIGMIDNMIVVQIILLTQSGQERRLAIPYTP